VIIVSFWNRKQVGQSKVCVNAFISMRILFSAESPGSRDQLPGKRQSAQFKVGVRWYGLRCRKWNTDRQTLPKQAGRNFSMRLKPRALFLENDIRCK